MQVACSDLKLFSPASRAQIPAFSVRICTSVQPFRYGCCGMQLEELLAELGAKEYDTDAYGMRRVEAAHALGEGELTKSSAPCRPCWCIAGSMPRKWLECRSACAQSGTMSRWWSAGTCLVLHSHAPRTAWWPGLSCTEDDAGPRHHGGMCRTPAEGLLQEVVELFFSCAGAYSIVTRGKDTRLEYVLDVPLEPIQLQQEFCIGRTGDYVLVIKARRLSDPLHGTAATAHL